MEVDLNEENYNYEKLLNLFCLSSSFTKEDLKKAKKKVLQLHPDKCDLPVIYYHFFRKMYYKIEEIFLYSYQAKSEDELTQQIDIQTHFKDYLEQKKINPKNNFKQFSKEFNQMFEKVYINKDDDGHGNWLKSDDAMYDKNDLESSRTKAIQNAVVPLEQDIEETGLFTKQTLHSFDVKETHENPFFTMDVNEIYHKKPKYKSVQEFQQHRKKDEIPPYSTIQSEEFLKQKEDLLHKQSKSMAYEHMKQKEIMDNNYKTYIKNYLSITD